MQTDSTGIDLNAVKGMVIATIITPLAVFAMWFATAQQMNMIEDKIDRIEAISRQVPQSCTTETTKVFFWKSTRESCAEFN